MKRKKGGEGGREGEREEEADERGKRERAEEEYSKWGERGKPKYLHTYTCQPIVYGGWGYYNQKLEGHV